MGNCIVRYILITLDILTIYFICMVRTKSRPVLGNEDYCSGYMDPFGKWNNGFPCPVLEDGQPVFCCGTQSLKYCCVHPKTQMPSPVQNFTLLLGITFGIIVAALVVVLISCFQCSCCLLYKKRQSITRGSVYQMHCPSSDVGVANMYSLSESTVSADTPRTASRTSSSSRSRITMEPTTSCITYNRPYDINRGDFGGHNYSRLGGSRPGSIAFSDRSASTLSDITVREMLPTRLRNSFPGLQSNSIFEPPPPYTSPHSTLVAVRTSTGLAAAAMPPIPVPHTPPSMTLATSPNRSGGQLQRTLQDSEYHPTTTIENSVDKRSLVTFTQNRPTSIGSSSIVSGNHLPSASTSSPSSYVDQMKQQNRLYIESIRNASLPTRKISQNNTMPHLVDEHSGTIINRPILRELCNTVTPTSLNTNHEQMNSNNTQYSSANTQSTPNNSLPLDAEQNCPYSNLHGDGFSNQLYANAHGLVLPRDNRIPISSHEISSPSRPCNSAFIVRSHQPSDVEERRMFTATKF